MLTPEQIKQLQQKTGYGLQTTPSAPKAGMVDLNKLRQSAGVVEQQSLQPSKKTPTEIELAGKAGSALLGGALKVVGGTTSLYEKATELPFLRMPFKAVGSIVGGAGGVIGGLVGGIGETAKQTYNVTKGKGFSSSEILKSIAKTAKETAKFGFETGETGSKVAPLATLGSIPSALMGAAEIKKGADILKEGGSTSEAYMRAGGGLLGVVAAPLIKGKMLDTEMLTSLAPKLKLESKTVIEKAIDKGIKPYFSNTAKPFIRKAYYPKAERAFEIINENRPIIENAEGIMEKTLPKSRVEMLEGVTQAKTKIFAQYNKIAEQAGEQGIKFRTWPISQSLDVIEKDLKYSPSIRKYSTKLKTEIAELEGADPLTVQERIRDFNESLAGYYAGRTEKGKARLDGGVANLMRTELDNLIDGSKGLGYQKLKNDYGALSTVEKDLTRQVAVEARRNTRGIADITDIFTGADLMVGLFTGSPTHAIKGATGLGLKSLWKRLNDPNRYIKNAFEFLNKKTSVIPTTEKILQKESLIKPLKLPLSRGGARTSSGMLAGIEYERDENGKLKIKFNPTKAAMGVAGMALGTKAVKAFEKTGAKPSLVLKKKVEPLIEEAKKYKSAEEFVKAQGVKELEISKLLDTDGESIKNLGSKLEVGEKSYSKGNIDVAYGEDGVVVLDGQHRAYEAFQKGKKKIKTNILSKDEALNKYGNRWGGLEYILDDSKIKTKSQLTDIWNKAQTKVDPLIQEAKKYKSAEDFVKAQGTPLFHGTDSKFDTFKKPSGEPGSEGVFISQSRDNANYYKRTEAGEIKEVYLKKGARIWDYKNPQDVKALQQKIVEYIPENKNRIEWTKLNVEKDKIVERGIYKNYSLQIRPNDLERYNQLREKLDNFPDVGGADGKLLADKIPDAWYTDLSEVLKNPKVKNWFEQNYDGWKQLDHTDYGTDISIGVFSPDSLKTKSQLTDIWNKANKIPINQVNN